MQPACRKVKRAADYQREKTIEEREAPSKCARCSKRLPGRTWRAGDEFGRYCRNQLCREARAEARSTIPDVLELKRTVEARDETIDFLSEVIMASSEEYIHISRIQCPKCGLTSAIPGWVHPGNESRTTACQGTLNGAGVRRFEYRALALAWPFRIVFKRDDEPGEEIQEVTLADGLARQAERKQQLAEERAAKMAAARAERGL